MDNQRQAQMSADRGGGLRRMNTHAGPPTSQSTRQDLKPRRNTCSTDPSTLNQSGKSTLRILTKKDDTRRVSASRSTGALDRSESDRSAKSDGFMQMEDVRRSSIEKRMRKRSSSCDNMGQMFEAHSKMESDETMGNRVSSADNLAEMIAISREALFYTGGNSGGPRPRQTQIGMASRRNTFKESNPAQPSKDDMKSRRSTHFDKNPKDKSESGGTTVRVLTKKKDDPRGSSAQFRSSGASVGSVKSDGDIFLDPHERKASMKGGKMGKRSSSCDNLPEAVNIDEIMALSKQARKPSRDNIRGLPLQQSHGGQDRARRNTVKAPPREPNDEDLRPRRNTAPDRRTDRPIVMNKLSGSTNSDGASPTQGEARRNRPTYSRKRSSSLDETRDVQNVNLTRVKSSNALHQSSIGQDRARRSTEKFPPRKPIDENFKPRRNTAPVKQNSQQMGKGKSRSANSLGDLQVQGEAINTRPNSRKSSSSLEKLDEMLATSSGDKPRVYDNVLLDLFSSIAAASQSKNFKNNEISISDRDLGDLDQAFSRQNSSFHSTPSPNGIPKLNPEQFNALIGHTQMPLTASDLNPRLHHKRSSSGDAAVAPDRLPIQDDRPLNKSTRSTQGDPQNTRGSNVKNGRIAGQANAIEAQKEVPHAQDRQAKSDSELELYDEISRSSDPKIGKWIGVPDGTTSTEPEQSFLMRSVGGGFYKGLHLDGTREHRSHRCHPYSRFFAVGLLLLLTGMGIGGYFLFFHDTDAKETSDVTDTPEEMDDETSKVKNETGASVNPSDITVIAPPPPDIEARCSASNFPGSLSACLAACIPSACCYPEFTGETCFENSGCSSYKPHCDPFYDAWIGSTEGVLRNVTDEVANNCAAMNNIIIDEMPSTPVSSSTGGNRLRGHANNGNHRALKQTTSAQTCENYCISARCCSAPIISSPELSGVILSPTGVYTNASTGEYVMTNCRRSNIKNEQLCAQYETFCSTDDSQTISSVPGWPTDDPSKMPVESAVVAVPMPSESPLHVPVPSPTNEFAPINETISNGSSSFNPSQAPTIPSFNNLSPTPSTPNTFIDVTSNASSIIVPTAPSSDIQEACTGNKVAFLIATGDQQAWSACAKACKDGLCCFRSQLGYDWMNSCYDGNEQVCADYSPCLILQQEVSDNNIASNGTVLAENDTVIANATDDSNVTSDATIVEDNSTELFDQSANDSNSTLIEDNTFESPGESANNNNFTLSSDEAPTNEENNPTQDDFQQSTNNTNSTLTTYGPPIPELDLSILCSEEFIAQTAGLNECLKACDLGRCCNSNDSTTAGCYSTHTEICFLYTPCNNAYSVL